MSKGDIIRRLRESKGMTLDEVGSFVGVSKQTIYKYETGIITNIPSDKIEKIARILGVEEAVIMGWDKKDVVKSIPLLGRIAAGVPITALENVEDWFELDNHLDADFVLMIKGDSMNGACIYDGDYAFFKQCKTLENGQIGAVFIDNDKTVKRFYKTNGTVTLLSENPNYAPIVLTSGDVRILGKLVACLRFF